MNDKDPKFRRIHFTYQNQPQHEAHLACKSIRDAINLRNKYVFVKNEQIQHSQDCKFEISIQDGVYFVEVINKNVKLKRPPPMSLFYKDYSSLLYINNEGPVKTYSYWRLKILERKFILHSKLNKQLEMQEISNTKNTSPVVKVDTHVHLATAMTRKHLVSFIKNKAEKSPQEEVTEGEKGEKQTLSQVLQQLNLGVEQLTIENLDILADSRSFERFEIKSKYNPFGFSELKNIFMKTSNHIQGRYLAEITKELFHNNERGEATEYRITIYGSKRNEWQLLSRWVSDNNIKSANNRWLIQIPRIFKTFSANEQLTNFQDMLENIFYPLFQNTLDPDSDPVLAEFLAEISGFDSVDDESSLNRMDKNASKIPPEQWSANNPPYAYYIYYMYANIYSLNRLREFKGLNTFDFRPHCGESGEVDNLVAGFLLANGINHGINLHKSMPLQYLYYLCGIGVAVSPLSNNALVLDYKRNPFAEFFKRGLNVSLSTDNPLQCHYTQNPLKEEYVVASRRWKLSACDQHEIARNSVLQSGFSHETKKNWLGANYLHAGTSGNDINLSKVSNVRIIYRAETLTEEKNFIREGGPILQSIPLRSSSLDLLPFIVGQKEDISYNRVSIKGFEGNTNGDAQSAINELATMLSIREEYKTEKSSSSQLKDFEIGSKNYNIKCVDGIVNLYHSASDEICSYDLTSPATYICAQCDSFFCTECDKVLHKHPSKLSHSRRSLSSPLFSSFPIFSDFLEKFRSVVKIASLSDLRSYCSNRLEIIDHLFAFHVLLNERAEHKARMEAAVRKKEEVLKVDNHVHLAGMMTAGHLLKFIRRKLRSNKNDLVKGQETLIQMFERLGIDEKNATLDSLGVKADSSMFHRFDSLSSKYRPFGSSDLHRIFLRRTNDMEGKYFAEIVKEALEQNEKLGIHTETGISIYGRNSAEWDYLGWWTSYYNIDSPTNRWVVQIPRLYWMYKKNNEVANFQELLSNIFIPLLDASKTPERHPFVASFLEKVTAFDIVDDEGQVEMDLTNSTDIPLPENWDREENPSYAYYAYYIFANLSVVNECRKSLGKNTFAFRPHCGATGDINHLAIGFMLADNIVHGLNLRQSIVFQYLYYLAQIGITCSVVSEDSLYIKYEDNPFPTLFRRGLNVTLSTDSPLLLHSTNDPLSEEYAIAANLWKLSECDLCEIARNSRRQAGLCGNSKYGNENEQFSGVPEVRLKSREEILSEEKLTLPKL